MAVGVNVKYEWDFGDGNTSYEANPVISVQVEIMQTGVRHIRLVL